MRYTFFDICKKRECLRNSETMMLFICAFVLSVLHVTAGNSNIVNSMKYKHKEGNTFKATRIFNHFWTSTGFCPPDPHSNASSWLLSSDMKQNLAFISALPYRGIEQVRIHWLLNTVHVTNITSNGPAYDFTYLDLFLDILVGNGLYLGFELMGNPDNLFNNFENATQVYWWRDLVHQIATRYVDRFGLQQVLHWNFESWNEPSYRHFDSLNFTLNGFLNYVDASAEGLRLANANLRFGVPGGGCHAYRNVSFCWAVLSHCAHGINFFTGQVGTNISFISIHAKGSSPKNTEVMMSNEASFIITLNHYLPELNAIPFQNNEADPDVGWNVSRQYQADATYAAMVVKVIVAHYSLWNLNKEGNFELMSSDYGFSSQRPKFELLSNDNGFLSYRPYFFTQRTLLARFQINSTAPPHVQFIRKPIYTVLGLLSLLDHQVINVSVTGSHTVGYMATVYPNEIKHTDSCMRLTIIVYNSLDSYANHTINLVSLTIPPGILPSHRIKYVAYRLDNRHGNPYKVWRNAGSPETPNNTVLALLRQNEEPWRVHGPKVLKVLQFKYYIPLPGILLFHACSIDVPLPGRIISLQVSNITCNQVLIVWSDMHVNSKCIKTYEVEYAKVSAKVSGTFHRINERDIIFNLFVYAPVAPSYHKRKVLCDGVDGMYRVRAIDYWERKGQYSAIATYYHF